MSWLSDIWGGVVRIFTPAKEVRKIFTLPEPIRDFLGITDKKQAAQLGFTLAVGTGALAIGAGVTAGGVLADFGQGVASALFPTAIGMATPITGAGIAGATLGSAVITGVETVAGVGTLISTTEGIIKGRAKYQDIKAIEPVYVPFETQPLITSLNFSPVYQIDQSYFNQPAEIQGGGYLMSEGYGRDTGIRVSKINGLNPVFNLLTDPFIITR